MVCNVLLFIQTVVVIIFYLIYVDEIDQKIPNLAKYIKPANTKIRLPGNIYHFHSKYKKGLNCENQIWEGGSILINYTHKIPCIPLFSTLKCYI